ncbi:hypothetical protein FA13DRAFT_234621 [Coprinellus micaceus]|uniref:Zn(2)-C6 fungal-type domain-containing protein n=1 Tax=Coprinellus micaceus TaxID=71717 RepID=A0A4Y7TG68_COPMI|nr:hypothetical protein FA13DRAFT_234621 [Coprinellus micaceus]
MRFKRPRAPDQLNHVNKLHNQISWTWCRKGRMVLDPARRRAQRRQPFQHRGHTHYPPGAARVAEMSALTSYTDSAQAATSEHPSSSSTPPDDDAGKKKKTTKRRKVNHACLYCRRSHMTCDEGRPCQRW